jgi:hypothetical protein
MEELELLEESIPLDELSTANELNAGASDEELCIALSEELDSGTAVELEDSSPRPLPFASADESGLADCAIEN